MARAKRAKKLTPGMLRKMVLEEKTKLRRRKLRESDPIVAGLDDPEKVTADEVEALPRETMVGMYNAETKTERLAIVSFSYTWETADHPDPEGRVAKALVRCVENFCLLSTVSDAPLFWDHKSLPQHAIDPRWNGGPRGVSWGADRYPKAFRKNRSPRPRLSEYYR